PGPGRQAARTRMGADAQHIAYCHLRSAVGRRAAGTNDFHYVHLIQPACRWLASIYGNQGLAMHDSLIDTMFDRSPKDVGGPAQPLLIVKDVLKHFPLRSPILGRKTGAVKAVDGVNFEVFKHETLGIVGESGCGKATTARLLLQLIGQDTGELIFDGQVVGSPRLPMTEFRRQVQMVFQDSYSSLNPRMTIEEIISFAPTVHGVPKYIALERAHYLLNKVGLDPVRFAGRYPHELSGEIG